MVGRKHGINVGMNVDAGMEVRDQLMSVLQAVRADNKLAFGQAARNARYHRQYGSLNLDLGDKSYFCDKFCINTMCWAFKAQVDLNYTPWVTDKNFVCSLCNLQEDENVFHFVA